jgi:rare lipoprotein A
VTAAERGRLAIRVRLAARLSAMLLAALLAGCGMFGSREPAPVGIPKVAAPKPAPAPGAAGEPLSRYGNPEFYVVDGIRYVPLKTSAGYVERGIASWYGPDFHGELTSTRESYDMYQMSGAHKTLPLPCWVEVTNLENGRKVRLRLNDRGPFKDNRIIDLSYAAALKLDVVQKGTAFVEVRAVAGPSGAPVRVAAAPAPATGTTPRMYLQVGAFGERANADRMRLELEPALGAPVRVFEDTAHAPPLYKVQLGPIRDVNHADQLVSALATVGIATHHFVNQ